MTGLISKKFLIKILNVFKKLIFVFIVQEAHCNQEAGTSDLKPQAVVSIELQLKNLRVTSKNPNDKVEEILVQNCKSSDDIFNYAASIESTTFKKVLLLRFEFLTDFSQLSQSELQKLNEAFTGRDVVVTLNGKESATSSIYWRGKEFKDFVALLSFSDESTEKYQQLYQFIVDFLVQCLSNGQSGTNN